jgi:two-component system nitrogen regulation response regulator GlnG
MAHSPASNELLKPAAPVSSPSDSGVTASVVLNMPGADWEQGLEAEAMSLLVAGRTDIWDVLINRFEARLIQTALVNTRGRRIEAAQKLGIGRNTITRKIQELGLDE